MRTLLLYFVAMGTALCQSQAVYINPASPPPTNYVAVSTGIPSTNGSPVYVWQAQSGSGGTPAYASTSGYSTNSGFATNALNVYNAHGATNFPSYSTMGLGTMSTNNVPIPYGYVSGLASTATNSASATGINGTTIPAANSTALGLTNNATGGYVTVPSGVPATSVYIAFRTDGVAGTGTQSNPYDGSTQTKFDAVMAAIPANTVIHIGAGTFSTFGVTNWALQTGWKVIGSGRGVTTVQLTGGTVINGGYDLFSSGQAGQVTNNVEIRNMTLSVNYGSFTPVAHARVNSNFINGNNSTFDNVEVINGYGDNTNGYEQFSLVIVDNSGGTSNNVINNCFTHSYKSGSNYTNGATLGGNGCVISNCVDDGANHAFTFNGTVGGTITGCTSTVNTNIGFYSEDGVVSNIAIVGNSFAAATFPIWFNGTGGGSSPATNVTIAGNSLTIASGNLGSTNAIIIANNTGSSGFVITGNVTNGYLIGVANTNTSNIAIHGNQWGGRIFCYQSRRIGGWVQLPMDVGCRIKSRLNKFYLRRLE